MNLIVFDLDGTLTATNEVDTNCFEQALGDVLGIDDVNTNWEQYEHASDLGCVQEAFFRKFKRPITAEATARFVTYFLELLKDHRAEHAVSFAEIPGAAAAIQRLKTDSKWAIALATGCWEPSARFKLATAGIPLNGVPTAFADDGPSRETIIQSAIWRAGNRFERIVCVGDAVWDVRAARRLELPFVGIAGARESERLRRAGATHTVENFLDQNRFMQAVEKARVPVQALKVGKVS
jgi:phosphoglycolate phosphatase-like HAD superfamily hydrolase